MKMYNICIHMYIVYIIKRTVGTFMSFILRVISESRLGEF